MPNIVTFDTKQSPRFEDDAWKWYEGNTFSLLFRINLVDENGLNIALSATDTLVFEFHKQAQIIDTFTFTNLERTAGTRFIDCELDFGAVIAVGSTKKHTDLFKQGCYTYCITYNGDARTTILSKGRVEVEVCH